MMFSRQDPEPFLQSFRVALWPRRSWSRSLRYIWLRTKRLNGSPTAIAYGFGCGAFISCTPFLGFHFVLAGILAYIGRGSLIASALGTFVGNPLTFPLFWVSTYQIGNSILGGDGRFDARQLKEGFATLWRSGEQLSWQVFDAAFQMLWPLIKPMTVGAVPVGLVVATVCFFIVKRGVAAAQRSTGGFDDPRSGPAVQARA